MPKTIKKDLGENSKPQVTINIVRDYASSEFDELLKKALMSALRSDRQDQAFMNFMQPGGDTSEFRSFSQVNHYALLRPKSTLSYLLQGVLNDPKTIKTNPDFEKYKSAILKSVRIFMSLASMTKNKRSVKEAEFRTNEVGATGAATFFDGINIEIHQNRTKLVLRFITEMIGKVDSETMIKNDDVALQKPQDAISMLTRKRSYTEVLESISMLMEPYVSHEVDPLDILARLRGKQ